MQMNDDSERELAALQAEVAQAEGLLRSITERLDEGKLMLAEARAGKSSAAVSSLELFEREQVRESVETRIALRKAKEKLDRRLSRTPANNSVSLHAVSAPTATIGKFATPPPKKTQLTMNAFLLVKSGDGKLRPLSGPKVIADSEDLTCQPCSKTFKSSEGLVEHQRHCAQFKMVSQGLSRDGRWLKKEIREDTAPRLAQSILDPPNIVDSEIESSVDGSPSDSSSANSDDESSEERLKAKGPQRGNDFRLTYRTPLKYRVILLAEGAIADLGEKKGALSLASDMTGIPYTNIQRWYKQKEEIRRRMLVTAGKKGQGFRAHVSYNISRGPRPAFGAAEQVVLAKFERARGKGMRVGPSLIKTWMRQSVRELYPSNPAASRFQSSTSWLRKFLKRHDLCERRATNKKEASVSERLLKVQKWHKRWQRI
jgi:hypothetical protein